MCDNDNHGTFSSPPRRQSTFFKEQPKHLKIDKKTVTPSVRAPFEVPLLGAPMMGPFYFEGPFDLEGPFDFGGPLTLRGTFYFKGLLLL